MILLTLWLLWPWSQGPMPTKFDSGYNVGEIEEFYPSILSDLSLPFDECELPYVVCPTSAIVTIIDASTFNRYGTNIAPDSTKSDTVDRCEDHSRGLWHSEDGHYRCRKAQP